MGMNKYRRPRGVRFEGVSLGGRFRGGKLNPVKATAFRENESGMLSQSILMELDPIAGRMVTPITAQFISVYVPVPAIDAHKNPGDDYPGNAEVVRQKLLSGAPLFDLEAPGEVSDRCGVVPHSVSGTKYVNEVVRLAHNVAVNHLRKRKYVKAGQRYANHNTVTNAIYDESVLDRFNGVLDPEDRVNGRIDFEGQIPVKGIGFGSTATMASRTFRETGETADTTTTGTRSDGEAAIFVAEDQNNPGFPNIYSDLSGAASVSLSDMYIAERTDQLVREMREVVDRNPQYGEEMVARFAHGLDVDVGNQPFVLYERNKVFGMEMERAMDGASLGTSRSNLTQSFEFTVPVPATEFGGIVITFAVVKPDETLPAQPHPILSQPWGKWNHVEDETAIDPVPVKIRELNADCALADEETVAFYVGNNHMLKNYEHYGFTRNTDLSTVENKTALWQVQLPMSLTPDNVQYTQEISQYPFIDQNAEICTYTLESRARINTPILFGPTPVEELAAIETNDLFEDAT